LNIEIILNELLDLSRKGNGNDNVNSIVELLNELSTFVTSVQDVNLRQWVSDYANYWSNPQNLINDMNNFKIETGELIAGYNNLTMMDFEF